jgi:hypothetical protein
MISVSLKHENTLCMRYLIFIVACGIAQITSAQHQIDFEIPDCPVVSSVYGFNDDFQLSVFPNPSGGLFQVSVKADAIQEELIAECFDVLGQRILVLNFEQSNEKWIDLSHFGAGVYHLVFTSGIRRYTRQLIVY